MSRDFESFDLQLRSIAEDALAPELKPLEVERLTAQIPWGVSDTALSLWGVSGTTSFGLRWRVGIAENQLLAADIGTLWKEIRGYTTQQVVEAPAGVWAVVALVDGPEGLSSGTRIIRVDECDAGEAATIVVEVRPDCMISGRVIDAMGRGVPNQLVQIVGPDESTLPSLPITSGADGYFSIRAVVWGRQRVMTFSPRGAAYSIPFRTAPLVFWTNGAVDVQCPSDREHVVPVRPVPVVPIWLELELPSAYVHLAPVGAGRDSTRSVHMNDGVAYGGEFSAGTWRFWYPLYETTRALAVITGRNATTVFPVGAGVVELRPGRRVSGRTATPIGSVVLVANDATGGPVDLMATGLRPDGTWHFDGVPENGVSVEWIQNGSAIRAKIPDGTHDVTDVWLTGGSAR